jgi:hypothetical protein
MDRHFEINTDLLTREQAALQESGKMVPRAAILCLPEALGHALRSPDPQQVDLPRQDAFLQAIPLCRVHITFDCDF